ncbi:MAG: elongation factor P--(R)-beta-lysine ligase [Legionellales bacterium]|nr:elongation factor P--(R)-beta-lysine ligase [Legionellales bacterium]
MIASSWRPTSSLENMQLRAKIYTQIRQFFSERDVLEVDTPIMSHAAVSDPHLASVSAIYQELGSSKTQVCYLQTSPEYPMKRLLAAGCPSIYQLCKVFRNGETGQFHNPEFTMLEWYRLGWDDKQLMHEVDELFQLILKTESADRLSYEDAFLKYVSLNPHTASIEALQQCAEKHEIVLLSEVDRNDRDLWLQLLMSEVIERKIGQHRPIFIYDFPSSQAALARVNPNKPEVAARFEAYFKGIELVNGFHELADADEQSRRFDDDLSIREKLNLPLPPRDDRFLAALASGQFPDCAGVALGVDRLIMLAAGAESLSDVISFPFLMA